MSASFVEIPTEIRLLIFSSLSLRDISRLRQCCSVLKNNLQDLSFMKVLDFSYSPDITSVEFSSLLYNRINAVRNNIIKAKFDRMKHLDCRDLEKMFQILPRIKHIRYRGFSGQNLAFFLQQENLESISYYNVIRSYIWQAEEFSLKCTKLTRLKIYKHAFNYEVQPNNEQKNEEMKLLEMNPALKNDVHFLKLALMRTLYEVEPGEPKVMDYIHTIMDSVLTSTDVRVVKWFWLGMNQHAFEQMMNDGHGQKMMTKTIGWLRTLPANQLESDHLVHTVCYKIGQCTSQYKFINPIAKLYEPKNFKEKADKSMKRFAKRPFHQNYLNKVLEYFKVRALQMKFPSIDAFEEELNSFIAKLGSTEVPWQFKLIQANVLVWRGQYQKAYNAYYSLIDPHLSINKTTVYGLQAAALIGAYHMANDYIKSAELLQQLKELNSMNFNTIVNEYTRCQASYDKACCTHGTKSFMPQYVYSCLTCASVSMSIFCYSCAKKCHANHQVLYQQFSSTNCDCNHGK